MQKEKKKKLIKILTSVLFVVGFFVIALKTNAATYFEDDFDGYADSPANHGWGVPSAATVENSDSPNGGRAMKFTIQATGTAQYWSEFDPNPSGEFSDGYVAFWAKVEGHTDGTAGGVKWIKLFSADYGGPTPNSYANVTFGQAYGSGQFWSLGTGDGWGISNDTQAEYRYIGTVAAGSWSSGTSYSAGYTAGYGTNKIYSCKSNHVAAADNQPGVGANWQTYWDLVGTITTYSASFYAPSGWHFYEYRVKHNIDNNFDGEFAVWVDGVLKIRVENMRNRNNANSMDWNSASLVNHVENAAPSEYYIYFDDIKTSDTYLEYTPSGSDVTSPANPSGLSVS